MYTLFTPVMELLNGSSFATEYEKSECEKSGIFENCGEMIINTTPHDNEEPER